MGVKPSAVQNRLGLLQVCTLDVFPKETALANREHVEGANCVLPCFTSKLCTELPNAAAFPLLFNSFLYHVAETAGCVGIISKFRGIITLESFAAGSYGLFIGAAVLNRNVAVAFGPATLYCKFCSVVF